MRIYPFYLKILDFCYRFLRVLNLKKLAIFIDINRFFKFNTRKNQIAKNPVSSGRMGIVIFFIFFLWSILASSASVSVSKTDIRLWHSLAGHLGQELQQLVNEFNQSQNRYLIKPIYKGEYTDAITSFAAAFKAKQPPALIQIYEVGTGIMLSPKGIIKPLHELMSEHQQELPTQFLPALLSFYSYQGKLQALPFNTSIPVIYYNADALEKVGIHTNNFPKTWDELERVAATLKAEGFQCVYTSAYPAWIHIEAFSALHGLPLIEPSYRKVIYNNNAIIKHLKRLKKWQEKHYFDYGGRASDATVLFTSGRCPIYSQSSGSYVSLSRLVNFHLGVAQLPLDSAISSVRHHNVTGGAALWAVAGLSSDVYQGIAQFYTYLLKPEVQQRWYQHTGYIPISLDGAYDFINQDSSQSILQLAKQDLAESSLPNADLGTFPQNQIRMINDEEMEAIFAGIKTPKAAINDAAMRANFILLRFLRNTQHL